MEDIDRELSFLQEFADQRLRKGSLVYGKVQDLIAQTAREREIYGRGRGVAASTACRVLIRIDHPTCNGSRPVDVPVDCTMESLKRMIEQQIAPSNHTVERILNRRTGKAYTSFDGKRIDQCEIQNGDEVVVTVKCTVDLTTATGVDRVKASGVNASGAFEYLSLVLHAFMLDLEFVPVVEMPNTVPGFAPPLKELPKTTFIHSSWNAQPQQANFMYKHKAVPGKQFLLVCVDMGESAMVTLAQRGGETQSMEVNAAQYLNQTAEGFAVPNAQALAESLRGLACSVAPALRPRPAPAAAAAPTPAPAPAPGLAQAPPAGPSGYPAAPGGYAPRGGPGSVGGADMDPFYGGVHVGGGRGLEGRGVGPRVDPAGGNLVGPDHPMFFPGQDDPYGGFGGLGGLPQPRFDPFGPVLGPNQDIGGAGVGNVGIPGRGGRGGRGSGRGGRTGYQPGEPNPDHLKPPGW